MAIVVQGKDLTFKDGQILKSGAVFTHWTHVAPGKDGTLIMDVFALENLDEAKKKYSEQRRIDGCVQLGPSKIVEVIEDWSQVGSLEETLNAKLKQHILDNSGDYFDDPDAQLIAVTKSEM